MPPQLIIHNARIVGHEDGVIPNGWIRCSQGRVEQIGRGERPDAADAMSVDAKGHNLLPGFIDVHVHGGAGHDTMDATQDALTEMAAFYAQHGVTSFLATTWTDTPDRTLQALENIRTHCGEMQDGATLLGAHLEGPYLNPDKCGAQNTALIRRPTVEEVEILLNTNVIRLLSLAPEYDDDLWLIERCREHGITVSAAHTAASYDQIRRAVQLGLSHATHTYNAMTGLHHREPGTLGAVLTIPQIMCELIADNIHVHPGAMQLVHMAKGIEGVILITDAVRAAGMPDGEYEIDERRVVLRDGAVRLEDGTLAGSALTMERALRNFMSAVQQPLEAVWRATSFNAARSLGFDDRKGSIEVGKDADLVLVSENIDVLMTIANGRLVYRNAKYASY